MIILKNMDNSIITKQVLSLCIEHEEGGIPMATLVLPTSEPWEFQEEIHIVQEDGEGNQVILFVGEPLRHPIKQDLYTKSIRLLALPKDLEIQYRKCISAVKAMGAYHPAFLDERKNYDPSEYLEATPHLFCYHRVTREVSLSHLFKGRETRMYKDEILADSLKYKVLTSSLTGVRLILQGEWVQKAQGEINVMPFIAGKFPGEKINTLTPYVLKKTWPIKGESLGHSGYSVAKSSIRLIDPPYTGGLNLYPTLTDPLSTGQRYKRYWLEGELVLNWRYRQKRREILNLIMTCGDQENLKQGRKKVYRDLRITLNSIEAYLPGSHSGKFFDTPEAEGIIIHALKIMACHLAYRSRNAEVIFQLPFEKGLDLHLDQTIILENQALPHGRVRGKLIAYRLEMSPKSTRAIARIACMDDFPVGKVHRNLKGEEPCGIVDPSLLNSKDVIQKIKIFGDIETQLKELREGEGEGVKVTKTSVYLKLKSLKSKDVLERHLWMDPCSWTHELLDMEEENGKN